MDGADRKRRGSQRAISTATKHRRWSASTTVTPSVSSLSENIERVPIQGQKKTQVTDKARRDQRQWEHGTQVAEFNFKSLFCQRQGLLTKSHTDHRRAVRENFKNWPKTVTF